MRAVIVAGCLLIAFMAVSAANPVETENEQDMEDIEDSDEVHSQAPYGHKRGYKRGYKHGYKHGFRHKGHRIGRHCVRVCKTVERIHKRIYYGQLAQIMAATIQREAELEEACNKNPEAVKPEDLHVDLDDNEQDLDSAYRRPLKGYHHKTKVCTNTCHHYHEKYGGYHVKYHTKYGKKYGKKYVKKYGRRYSVCAAFLKNEEESH